MGRHIYVHNPFCISKCPYCDFYSCPNVSKGKIQRYYETCVNEVRFLAANKKSAEDDHMDTIYFGGGTPSYPDAEHITTLLKTILEEFGIKEAEKTIEVNPSSLDMDKAGAYLDAGFNRVSVGIQSLDDEVLKLLGRRHDRKGAIDALKILKDAGFENISADLMTGVPGQSVEGIKNDCLTLASLGVKHISTYSLAIEEGTMFFEKYKNTIEDIVSPDLERKMYHETLNCLEDLGYKRYEISNSALPGFESRHNTCYWDGAEYYGIGAGAHGYLESVRYGHKDDIDGYIKDFRANVYTEEVMSEEEKMREYPFLALRTKKGIDTQRFKKRFGKDIHDVFSEAINKNVSSGLLEDEPGFIRLTLKGLDLANQVSEDFL